MSIVVTDQSLYQQRVDQHFSKAAKGYHSHSEIQRRIGLRLLNWRPHDWDFLIDVGCGPGSLTPELVTASQHYLGIDLSTRMLQQAQSRLPEAAQWLAADAVKLPLANQSVDGYFANMSVQWSYDLALTLKEMLRVLRKGGTALLSLPISGTFDELQQSFLAIDNHPHTQTFVSRPQVEQWLNQLNDSEFGFQQSVIECDTDVQWFDSVTDALKSIKGVGANYVARRQNSGLLSPRQYARMSAEYERFRTTSGIPLTWQTLRLKVLK